ncbi:MAG: SDR family NAD(P)-dependent oxidoreductase [Rickettsiales bacterium]|jgi:short-subunit dehydrogenase|nr:SDR family NAD(P)-dependent oxidoreductase [Rickettsiales bacterium]
MNIIIVGSSYGIGKELAKQYFSQLINENKGGSLTLIARDIKALNELRNELNQNNNQSKTVRVIVAGIDVTKQEEFTYFLQNTVKQQKTDLFIYCAGVYSPNNLANIDLKIANQTIAINFTAIASALSIIIPQMKIQKSGQIVLFGSVAGYRGLPNSGFYGATKAGIINLAETLYTELKPYNIAVSLVNPGFVKTRLTDANNFKMPCLISANEASSHIIKGINQKDFEIHFPKKFTLLMKLIKILPNKVFFKLSTKLLKNNEK